MRSKELEKFGGFQEALVNPLRGGFQEALVNPLRGVFLGFDVGSKKIGVAVGQRVTGTASPLETVRVIAHKPDWNAVTRLIHTWRPEGLVVGIAYQQDGSENPITQAMLRFARQLHGRYGLPVYTVDETLTTFESRQMLYDDLKVRRKTYLQAKDELAAQLILQTWLSQATN